MVEQPDNREQPVSRALEALAAAMQEATIEELQFLHGVLEKGGTGSADYRVDVSRGSWGDIDSTRLGAAYSTTACPLTALVLGRAPVKQEDLARLPSHRFVLDTTGSIQFAGISSVIVS